MESSFFTHFHLISGFVFIFLFQKWAVDQNTAACKSLKLNHPNTQVRILSARTARSFLENYTKSNDAVVVYRLGMMLLETSSNF